MKTTIEEIMKYNPCQSGIDDFVKKYGRNSGDVSFREILESNGIQDAIWCLRVFPDYDLNVLKFKYLCARRVEHLDTSGTAKKCLNVLEMYLDGEVSKEELKNAANDAANAYDAANANASAAYDAAIEAYAGDAAGATTEAYSAAVKAASAAYAASAATAATEAYAVAAAGAAANAGAASAEREYQTKIFIEIFCQDEK